MTDAIAVRRLDADDWQVLREVRLVALADAPDAFASSWAREHAYEEADWRRILTGGGCSAVAWRENEPVGLVGGYVHDGQAELVSMWVAPSARGSSAADSLIKAVVGWAREIGAAELTLWVVEGNDRAERVYARHGYSRTGARQPVPGRPEEIEFEMALALAT
jgi:GNAT superfamily N-acetyltransferase